MLFTVIIALLITVVLQFIYKQHKINNQLKGFVIAPGPPLLKHFHVFNTELGRYRFASFLQCFNDVFLRDITKSA